MKNLRIKLYALLLLLIPLGGFGQLGIGNQGLMGLPDTASYGDTAQLSYWVVNRGILPVVGPIYTLQEVNGTLFSNPLDSLLLTILPGDSALMTVNDYIFSNQTHSQTGANTVVVWPANPGSATQDSVTDTVYIRPTASARAENLPELEVKVYPNPAGETLYLHLPAPLRFRPAFFELLDPRGRLIHSGHIQSKQIDLHGISPGIYLLRISSEGFRPKTIRIQKT